MQHFDARNQTVFTPAGCLCQGLWIFDLSSGDTELVLFGAGYNVTDRGKGYL